MRFRNGLDLVCQVFSYNLCCKHLAHAMLNSLKSQSCRMILSAEELEILEYLKGYSGKYVPMVEICRRAGGRQRYSESPQWARTLMQRLVDSKMVEVNERGHYRVQAQNKTVTVASGPAASTEASAVVAEDFFPGAAPAPSSDVIVDENYFAPPETDADKQWVSPHIAEILKKSGKKFGSKPSGE
jgi:hypothetical protein